MSGQCLHPDTEFFCVFWNRKLWEINGDQIVDHSCYLARATAPEFRPKARLQPFVPDV